MRVEIRQGETGVAQDRAQREREEGISRLALRYRSGDRAALGELHAALEPAIRAFLRPHLIACRSLPPGVEPEDLFQQSYVALAEAALEWEADQHDNFVPYFLRSFPWRIDRYLRSQTPSRRSTRLRLYSVPHDLLMEQIGDRAGMDGRDWDEVLGCAEVLRGLPRPHSQVVRLHLYHGLPFAEVGRVLGISRSSAHELFGRAIPLMRSMLAGPPAGSKVADGASRVRTGVSPDSLRRCVEVLHMLSTDNAQLPGRELLCREAGLTWREHKEIMSRLSARGCVVGRRRGYPGSLACGSPAETMRRLEDSEA